MGPFPSTLGAFARLAAVFATSAVLCGCYSPFLGDPSGIPQKEWRSLKAVYLVRDDTGLHAASWSTQDRQILERLRGCFPTGKVDIAYGIGLSHDNRVDIEIANGQWWVVSDFPHAQSMTVLDPYRPKRSYSYNYTTSRFHDALRETIETVKGNKVDFDLPLDRNDADELEGERSGTSDYEVDAWGWGSGAGTAIAPPETKAVTATASMTTATASCQVMDYTNVPAGPGTHYLVVDLSGGSSATNYPVSYLAKAPQGGWTEEHKTTKLVLRRIPATTPDFTMGSPRGELGRYKNETQHTVTLSEDFFIGVFEVTQRQWELVMGSRSNWFTNVKYYQTRPVEKVSYYAIRENPNNSAISPHWPQSNQVHADSFMGKLRAKTGLSGFDLPTEAQWEYACRAGTAPITALNSGYNLRNSGQDANMDEVGRYWYNGGTVFNHDCAPNSGTALVGSYRPNMWGLYDMHGNVHEWCLDWFGDLPEAVIDPKGATSGSYRVHRGGSFRHAASACRSASRDCSHPGNQYNDYGFRVYCKP